MALTLPDRLLFVTAQGLMRASIGNPELVQDAEGFIRRFAADRPATFRGGTLFREDVHVVGSLQYFAFPMLKLPLMAHHRPITLPDGTLALTPCFRADEGAARMDMEWDLSVAFPAAANAKLFFVVALESGSFYNSALGLTARDGNGRMVVYRLPLANIHNDAHLCHGQVHPPDVGSFQSPREAALDFHERWLESDWNADLMPTPERTAAVVRFDPQTMATLPAHREWRSQCWVVSNPTLDWLIPGA